MHPTEGSANPSFSTEGGGANLRPSAKWGIARAMSVGDTNFLAGRSRETAQSDVHTNERSICRLANYLVAIKVA